MSVMSASPEGLRGIARELGGQAQSLRELGSGVSDIGLWTGLAAYQQQEREEGWCSDLQRCVPALESLAERIGGFARTVESIQDQWLRWESRLAGWRSEAQRLVGTIQSVDAVTAVVLEQRRHELLAAMVSGEEALARLNAEFEAQGEQLGRAVMDSWPVQLAIDGLAVHQIYRGFKLGSSGLRQAAAGTGILSLAIRLSKTVDLGARSKILREMWLLAEVARRVGPTAKVPLKFLPGVATVTTLSSAIPDVIDGNGYEGWRGTTTQVLAGLAIPGSILMLLPHPVAVAAGVTVAGAYNVWLGGNMIYDNRVVIARYGLAAYQFAGSAAREIAGDFPRPEEVAQVSAEWLRDNILHPPDIQEMRVPVIPVPGPLPNIPVNVPIPQLPNLDFVGINLEIPQLRDWGEYVGPAPPIPLPSYELERPPWLPSTKFVPDAVAP